MNAHFHLLTRSTVSALTLALVLTACNSQNSASPATGSSATASTSSKAVAATVNGTPIMEENLDLVLQRFGSQNPGQANNPEMRKMILDQMIMQTLTAQEAQKKGLDKKPEIASQLELTRQSVLSNAYLQDYMSHDAITDQALNAEYEKVKPQLTAPEYKARHILVEKEDTANNLIAQLKKNPKAFESLAKANSLDPGSKVHGGDLGWFDARSMVPEFGEAVGKLEKGQMTQTPVKTKFGYHIIVLDDKRQKEVPPLDQIKPMLKQQMQQDAIKKMLDDLRAKAKVDITPVASAPTPAPAPTLAPAEKK